MELFLTGCLPLQAFLWHDAASRRWNCLYHQYSHTGDTLAGPGGYAYSDVDDILNWTWALPGGQTVYGFNVTLQTGDELKLTGRERPKLLLDKQGQPSVLYPLPETWIHILQLTLVFGSIYDRILGVGTMASHSEGTRTRSLSESRPSHRLT